MGLSPTVQILSILSPSRGRQQMDRSASGGANHRIHWLIQRTTDRSLLIGEGIQGRMSANIQHTLDDSRRRID